MRDLSKEELELVSGGVITLDAVYAMYSDPIWGFIGSFNLWNDGFSYEVSDGYFGDDGSTGGGGEPDPSCSSHDGTTVDQYVDELASKFARDIKAKPDDQRREYLAIMYRDGNGIIRTTDLIAGGAGVSVNYADLGFAPAQVVGYIHNHPTELYGNSQAEALLNRLPSDGSPSDWATADSMIAGGANAQELTLYVLGPDGRLREYDYASNAQYRPPTPSTHPGPTVAQDLQPEACNL